jgi:DNA adenine methylase
MNNGVTTISAKPFLKWVGGKGKLMPQLLPFVPLKFNDYYEPFLGGGAFYFSLPHINNAYLNDINKHLIDAYIHIRDDIDLVLDYLQDHHITFHSLSEELQKDFFLAKRDEYNKHTGGHPSKSALLIFLNKTCFNGLYRENKSGHFNVPFGKFASKPNICDEANLKAVSSKLQYANFYSGSYKEILKNAKESDFVYIDPPITH